MVVLFFLTFPYEPFTSDPSPSTRARLRTVLDWGLFWVVVPCNVYLPAESCLDLGWQIRQYNALPHWFGRELGEANFPGAVPTPDLPK